MADKKISQLTAASTPLAGTEVLPIVQSGSTVKVASNDLTVKNVRSNATTGILQVAGPGAGTTRTMTVPNANFTAARTDAAQTFTGNQTYNNNVFIPSGVVHVGETTAGMYLDVFNGTSDAQRVRITTSGTDGIIRATRSSGTQPNLLFQIDSTEYFKIGNTGNVTVNNGNVVVGTAGKGIDFSANSHAAGMTSELLNWYEQGNWTPTLSCGTSGTITLTSGDGAYTRVGNQVTVTCYIDVASVASPVGVLFVNGLPFTAGSGAKNRSAAAVYANGLETTATTSIVGRIVPSESRIRLEKFAAGVTSALAGDVKAGSAFQISLTYLV